MKKSWWLAWLMLLVIFAFGCSSSKNLQGIRVQASEEWKSNEANTDSTSFSYSKRSASGNIEVTGVVALVDEKVYSGKSKDFRKFRASINGTYKEALQGTLGKWQTLRVHYEDEQGNRTYYLYLINVPGNIDVAVTLAADSKEIESVVREWQQIMKGMKLSY